MRKLLILCIILLLFLQGCSLSTTKETITVDNNFLTDFFYNEGELLVYESIDRQLQYNWTGQDMGFFPRDQYRASDMKIYTMQDNLWIQGQILMEKGNYINYLTGATNGKLKNISVFGFLAGKPFSCNEISKSCEIASNVDYYKALVFKPWFDKSLYDITKETEISGYKCYTYSNRYNSESMSCLDSNGLIVYYEDSAKKIAIANYHIGNSYNTSISGN